MALTDDEVRERLDALASLLVPLLPSDWEEAAFSYHAVGSFEVASFECETARGTDFLVGQKLPGTGVYDLLRGLRHDCYRPDVGTWVSIFFDLEADGGDRDWSVSLDGPRDFPWAEYVTAADAARELETYPPPEGYFPSWLTRAAELHEIAKRFDPGAVLARPQGESELVALLPESVADLFARARLGIEDFVPGGADRLLIGRLADGCWSVVHADSAWLAVGLAGKGRARTVAFADARSALVHAMAQIMAAENTEINSEVLQVARVLDRSRAPRLNQDAWVLAEPGGEISRRTSDSPRPSETGARDESSIALDPLHNRPGGYFVCQPGPPPETGPYIGVREVFEMVAEQRLPKPPSPDRPRPEPPTEILPVGTEVDAYGHHDQCFVFAVGTPEDRRGPWNRSKERTYHVYRVEKPLKVYPGLFAPWRPPGDDTAGDVPAEQGQGYYLVDPIEEFVRSGHLVEIDRPGGDPVGSAGQ